jgi:DNA-binding transcriptional ArsR family regulator
MGITVHEDGSHDSSVTDVGEGSTGADAIDAGTVYEMLGNRRRRYVLHRLKQEDSVVDMGDLSTRVAAWEKSIDPAEVSYDERKAVHTVLYQHHVPKLDEAGLVDYDSRSGEMALTEAGAEVDVYLEAVSGGDIPWASYFLGLSAVAAVAALVALAGLLPVSAAAGTGGLVVAVVFLVSSTVFVYDNRSAMRLGGDGPPPEEDPA